MMDTYHTFYLAGLGLSLFANLALASVTSHIWGSLRVRREFRHYGVGRVPVNTYEADPVNALFYLLWGLLFLGTLGGLGLMGWAIFPAWILINWPDLILAAAAALIAGSSLFRQGETIQHYAQARQGAPSALGTIVQFCGAALLLLGGYYLWGARTTMDFSISIFNLR